MSRRQILRMASNLGVVGSAGCAAPRITEGGRRNGGGGGAGNPEDDASATIDGGRDYDVVQIPEDYETIQAGVDAASAGDLVLVAPGTYAEEVVVSTPGVTVRGRDRNEVVLDGGFRRRNAIEVTADGVAIENLTGRFYRGTGFYWSGVEGFRGSFLTAYNNGYYGIYAYDSRDGRFEHSYASGHPDAGFYLGRNRPYDAVISDVVAEYNAIGYSGTSTGGSLTVRDSVWRYNKVGIFPNTLDRADPPQRSSRLVGNQVYANNEAGAPALSSYPLIGMGILLWGGSDNIVAGNRVHDHDHFGIVVHPHVVESSGNEIRNNRVDGSDRADLALGRPAGEGNSFHDNEFVTSLPPNIESDGIGGSTEVTDVFTALERRAETGDFPAGDWRDQPVPGDQPSMPDPKASPRSAERATSWETTEAQTDGYGMA
ncbi:right-handed parallel beta-helix repeat-containing protein [Halegenticoccus soli]|uniref:right-handed parallel beta-helix repeat-containing protein n=1 Tax=Halegenticoccus soli TaxID=1985678 RepID=UPI001E65A630|nr:right-handed parallel beta-helix repeat-containing protein [Halegenticoccus soli]